MRVKATSHNMVFVESYASSNLGEGEGEGEGEERDNPILSCQDKFEELIISRS